MNEVWKDVPGHKYYQASSLGRIRSLPRTIVVISRWGTPSSRKVGGGILKQSVASTGYYVIGISGEKHTDKIEVHVWVAAAFLGPRPAGYHTHHKNEKDKLNNRPSNLDYIPHPDHAIMHNSGENQANGRLKNKDVLRIRQLLDEGNLTQKQIGDRYGIAQAHVSAIKLRKKWAHI